MSGSIGQSSLYGLPMRGMAQAYARLADPQSAPTYAPTLDLLAEAMGAHPWYVDGTNGPDTLLMERAGGRLVVKSGAEGVLCVAVRGAGVGLAIKMQSGRNEWSHAVAIDALRQLDLVTASEVEAFGELAHPIVRNHRRLRVGDVRPTFTLRA